MIEKGRAFSDGEGGRNRPIGASLGGSGYMGDEAAGQRSKVYLRVKLHISLPCYPKHAH